MVLDEEALEAMLRRQGQPQDPADMVTTDLNDEFEVYERAADVQENLAAFDEPQVPETMEVPPAFTQADAPVEPAAEPAPQAADEASKVAEPAPPAAPPVQPVAEAAPQQVQPVAEPVVSQEPPAVEPVPAAVPAEEPTPAPAEPEPAPPAAPTTEAPQRPAVWPPLRTHNPEPARQATKRDPKEGCRLAILQATFNVELTDMMAELSKAKAAKLGAHIAAHATVPGVYDLPLAAKHLLARDDVDALVVLGVVVQGETKHDEIITHATAKTLQELSLEMDKPIGLGITGPGMTWKQAEARVVNGPHAVEAAVALWESLVSA